MSTRYNKPEDVPATVLADRIDELVGKILQEPKANLNREFGSMRVPAEVDFDADIVLSEAARRLRATPPPAVGEVGEIPKENIDDALAMVDNFDESIKTPPPFWIACGVLASAYRRLAAEREGVRGLLDRLEAAAPLSDADDRSLNTTTAVSILWRNAGIRTAVKEIRAALAPLEKSNTESQN